MKSMVFVAALAAGAILAAAPATAGTIERACLKSDRKVVSRSLCGCIQQVADLTLDGRDQRLAAKFFKDPHRAQIVRQSANRGDEEFWLKYKQFGANAQAYCS